MTSNARIDVCDIDDTKIVRFRDHLLFDDKTVHEVMKQVEAVLPDRGSPVQLVLDFSEVAMISSAIMSKLILLQRRVDASSGTLWLRGMSSDIQLLFRRTNLDRLLHIEHEVPAAIGSW